ncbi:hypothetical protein F5877DRAFT_67099 [Lentinula edodes]|nr:hypothetical protein F5877DRAFT_67099 [Lentinula edodes]
MSSLTSPSGTGSVDQSHIFTLVPSLSPTSISSSNLKDSNSHIGAIIGVAVGGLIVLNIAIITLVLIYRSKRRSKQRFLEAFDRNGDFEPNRPGRKSTDETGTGAGEHLAVAEMSAGAQPRGITSYPFSSSTPVPPVMTALDGGLGTAADAHGETSVARSTAPTEGGFGGRSTRNVFIHQDGGRVEMASQDRLEEGEQEEIPPTYESLIRSIRSGEFWSRRSEIGSRVSSGRGASRNENETGRSGPGNPVAATSGARGETSAEESTELATGEIGGRNIFVHQDGGRVEVEMSTQGKLERGEQDPDEIPPTYESLIRLVRLGEIRNSNGNSRNSRSMRSSGRNGSTW